MPRRPLAASTIGPCVVGLALLGCSGPAPRSAPPPTAGAPAAAIAPAEAPAPACRPSRLATPPPAELPVTPDDRVTVSTAGLRAGGASPPDVASLLAVIRSLHQAWVSGETAAYLSRLSPDVTRMPLGLGEILRGPAAIAAALPREREAFERSGSRLALRLAIRDVELTVRDETATALYRVEVGGGARWGFDDSWQLLQAFERRDGRWLLLHEAAATGVEPAEDGASGSFGFDFVYPVRDLARALAFYRPILGEPESVTADRATFALPGGRFALDARALDGLASVRPGLPNGYAVFHVGDLAARIARLRSAGVELPGGIRTDGTDRYAVALDSSGNVFVLRETRATTRPIAVSTTAPRVETTPDTPPGCARPVAAFVTAWLHADGDAVAALHAGDARLFHDSGRTSGIARGPAEIAGSLERWLAEHDRSPTGPVAELDVRSLRVVPFGRGALASYSWTLAGAGPHPRRETALVTQLWRRLDGGAGSISDTFVVRAYPTLAMARALDYTGYPVTSLAAAERFYSRVLALGEPYRDESYRGWWSRDSVFGVYEATARDDGIPVARRANGYASFWVPSADAALGHLRAAGSTFPVIPAINTRAGAEREDGYVQVVATDSEGNVLLLSEYPGD